MKKLILFSILIFSLVSCGPTIHYLGDTYSYSSNEDFEVYYDLDDVAKNYVVIGQMTHDKFVNYDLDALKKGMVEKAKSNGADAIVFENFSVDRENIIGRSICIRCIYRRSFLSAIISICIFSSFRKEIIFSI